jgi:serine/threonine protein kinase
MLTGRPPFLNNNKNIMLKNLVTKPVPMPYYISEEAKSLLRGLFKIKPEDRLGFSEGASEIKSHKFFKDIDFEKLEKREIAPPISFKDSMKVVGDPQKSEILLNSAGFEKWNSWHVNFESPENKKTKMEENKQIFEGFTFE